MDINILLLGETGVGKSTFINSFANYIKFPSMGDAMRSELVCLIPTNFTITDEDYVEHVIKFGEDDGNEDHIAGNSSTQEAKEHVFKVPGVSSTVRIIDTPGVGDARGIEQDEKNIRNTVAYLKRFSHLNAICFVLKPSVTILSEYFKFCVTHLFSCVEKTAGANIIFAFTNTRSTFYRPGETMTLLQKLLREIADSPPHVHIPFSKDNMICVDNEAFRYLVAMREGHVFSEREVDDFSESWRVSSVRYQKMLNYIVGGNGRSPLEPHDIIAEVSVIEVRDRLQPLVKDFIDVYLTIAHHKTYLEKRQKSLGSDPVKNQLTIQCLNYVLETLDSPMVICNSSVCDEFSESKRGVYRQKCHAPCNCEIKDNKEVYKCKAMDTFECKRCACDVNDHKYIHFVGKHFAKPRILQPPSDDQCTNQVWFMDEMDKCVDEYKTELQHLLNIFAKMDHFFKESVIYGGSYEILGRIKDIYDCNSRGSGIFEHVQRLKETHQENLDALVKTNMQNTAVEMEDIINQVYQMKHVGTVLSKMATNDWEKPPERQKLMISTANSYEQTCPNLVKIEPKSYNENTSIKLDTSLKNNTIPITNTDDYSDRNKTRERTQPNISTANSSGQTYSYIVKSIVENNKLMPTPLPPYNLPSNKYSAVPNPMPASATPVLNSILRTEPTSAIYSKDSGTSKGLIIVREVSKLPTSHRSKPNAVLNIPQIHSRKPIDYVENAEEAITLIPTSAPEIVKHNELPINQQENKFDKRKDFKKQKQLLKSQENLRCSSRATRTLETNPCKSSISSVTTREDHRMQLYSSSEEIVITPKKKGIFRRFVGKLISPFTRVFR